MILTTHALVGAALGKNIDSLWILIPAALALHYALDGLRHGEYFDIRSASFREKSSKISLDIFSAGAIIFLLAYFFAADTGTAQNIFIGSFFSLLPDGLTFLLWTLFPRSQILKKIKLFHEWAHRYQKNPKYSPERQWTLKNARNDILLSAAVVAIFLLF